MPKVTLNSDRKISLPEDFLKRRHLPDQVEYWLDERNGDLILHPRLLDVRKLYIEPTTACNLQCRTCIRNIWQDPIEHMSLDTFQNLVDCLKDLPGLKRVVFTSFGEPFMHPWLLKMVEAIRNYDLAVTIGTNGLLLDEKIIHEIIRMGVDRIMVSIDGGKPETYTNVRGAILSQVIDNIRLLNETKHILHSLFPAVGIEFIALRSNVDELSELTKMAAQLNVSRLLVSNVLPYTEEMCKEALYSYEPLPPFKTSSWAIKAGAWVMWATVELPRTHWGAERRCRFIKEHAIVIGWDGSVSPCYALSHNYSYYTIDRRKKQVDRYILGNVNENSLAEIWMSEEYVRFSVKSKLSISHPVLTVICVRRVICESRIKDAGAGILRAQIAFGLRTSSAAHDKILNRNLS